MQQRGEKPRNRPVSNLWTTLPVDAMSGCLRLSQVDVGTRHDWTNPAVIGVEDSSDLPYIVLLGNSAVAGNNGILASETLFRTLDLENFATAHRSPQRIANLCANSTKRTQRTLSATGVSDKVLGLCLVGSGPVRPV